MPVDVALIRAEERMRMVVSLRGLLEHDEVVINIVEGAMRAGAKQNGDVIRYTISTLAEIIEEEETSREAADYLYDSIASETEARVRREMLAEIADAVKRRGKPTGTDCPACATFIAAAEYAKGHLRCSLRSEHTE